MRFLIQFIRFRRGVPEAIRTLPVEAADAHAALTRVTNRVGMGTWPMNTEAFRVMDDGGRTVLQRMVPGGDGEQTPSPEDGSKTSHLPLSEVIPDSLTEVIEPTSMGHPHFEVGQAITYAEDGKPVAWKGGYEIVAASDPAAGEALYTIRSADETHDRIAKEHELREDLGSRTRGQ